MKLIAKQYIFRGWFTVDFVSVFPFHLVFSASDAKVTKLFRLFRLPRLIKLIDIQRFNKLIKSLMSNTSRDERIVAQYMMLYVFKIFRLIIIAIIITYFIGCFWYMFITLYSQGLDGDTGGGAVEGGDSNSTAPVEKPYNFISFNNMESMENSHKLIISCYFALTTLSTVGYGDYYPVSNQERILAVLIMLGGVAFFSYIMGNFIEIISNYEKKMGVVDKSGDLHNWLLLLTRFTNN